MWAPTVIHGGFSAAEVEEIKRAVNIPVITVGRYTEPQFAELMVKEGRADLVAFGRQSLADPYMPIKSAGRESGGYDSMYRMSSGLRCKHVCRKPCMLSGKPIPWT